MDEKETVIDNEKSKDGLIAKAETAAEIVTEGIDKGEFSAMNDKLEDLSSGESKREQYVFSGPGIRGNVVAIVCAATISVGFLYFVLMSAAVLTYSIEFSNYGKIGLAASLVVILVNIAIVIWSILLLKFYGRYRKYVNVLKYRNIEIIDDLATYAKKDASIVVKDLEKAVKKKYIPQGHFGRNNIIFITSDDTYKEYQKKQAVYDRYYRKQVEERARMRERSKKMEQIMESGKKYVEKIHESNDIIKDKVISQKLDRMENVVSMIFHEVDINPAKADKLGLFLDYYLPTTERLLEAYIDLDEKKITGKSLEKAKKEIEGSLDTINTAFEGILNRFYQEQEMDIASDISAMEIMMKQEGLKAEEK